MMIYRASTTTVIQAALFGALLSSCSDSDSITRVEEIVSVCHMVGTTGSVIDIEASEFMEHRSHGDYVAGLTVRRESGQNGDGVHFARISDAIASARAGRMLRGETSSAKCRIVISVAPGLYIGQVNDTTNAGLEELPLTIDVPAITLLGSFVMSVDAKGRATGSGAAGVGPSPTILASNPGLVSIKTGNVLDKYAEPLIVVNGHPNGPRGDDAVIEGFILRSGNAEGVPVGGNAIWAIRVRDLLVRGNQIEGGFSEPIEMRASSGRVERNLLTGKGGSCAICLMGPGDYQVTDNRQTGLTGRLSVLFFPTIYAAVPPNVEPLVLPSSALVTGLVRNNEFRDHQEVPFGIGVRVAAIGPGAPDVIGTARVTAEDNDLSNNRFAIVAEAGFLVANTAQRGSIELTLKNNMLSGSCQVGLLVALNAQATAIGTQSGLSTRNSSYTIKLGEDIPWSSVWYSHPAGAGNSLTVDGQAISSGSRVTYDSKGC